MEGRTEGRKEGREQGREGGREGERSAYRNKEGETDEREKEWSRNVGEI